MITIGVTAVGSGIGQSVLRSLALSNLDFRVVGMDVSAYNSGFHWTDRSHVVPPIADRDRYLDRVVQICHDEQVDVLIPGLDPEFPLLAAQRDQFVQIGCFVLASTERAISLTFDKQATHDWCVARALPFVATLTLPLAQERADDLEYPLIVKPRSGSASAGVHIVTSAAELVAKAPSSEWIVQPYLVPRGLDLAAGPTPVTGSALQQLNEVSAQYVIGRGGVVLGEYVSMNRLKGGIPVEVVPISDASWISDGRPIAEALAEEGAVGPVNLQGRLNADGHVQFFELNTRFTGITGIRSMMGFREVEATIRSLVLDDEEGAIECLRFDPKFVGLRHVGDMVVPADRVAFSSGQTSLPADGQDATPRPRILVTGANGYVGSAVVANLAETQSAGAIDALVRHSDSALDLTLSAHDPEVTLREADILRGELDLSRIDTVIHLAAARPVRGTDESELYRVNVEGTRRLLLAAREAGVGRFIYLSTQSVYGTSRPPLWAENQPPQPDSAYGASKWLGEELCRKEIAGEMQLVILRAARVFGLGSRMRWEELPHDFARRAISHRPFDIHGDGLQRMDFIHVRDLASAIVSASRASLSPGSRTVLNVGGGHPTSLNELASLYPATVNYTITQGPPPANFGMDIRRARAVLGWAPVVTLEEAVAELLSAAEESPISA